VAAEEVQLLVRVEAALALIDDLRGAQATSTKPKK